MRHENGLQKKGSVMSSRPTSRSVWNLRAMWVVAHELAADSASVRDITQAYPHRAPAEVEEALQYARQFLKNDIFLTSFRF